MFLQLKENPIAFVIAGPTASGKTQLAIDLAKRFKGIIINADSQQVYKDITILSSQPEKKNLEKIPHKLFNFLDFYKSFSVKQWFLLTEKEIYKTLKNKKIPIIVGGTGMYLKALLDGFNILPDIPRSVRKDAIDLMDSLGSKEFYKRLKAKNILCVNNINPNDKNRLIRSWEIFKVSKKSIYELKRKNEKKKIKGVSFFKILIKPSRRDVYSNCEIRWKNMIKKGAIDEVKKIIKKENNLKKGNNLKTIGFKELKNFLEKKSNLEIVSKKCIKSTKNYAKRQYTWFKHQFSPNIVLKTVYNKKKQKNFIKEITDKLLTNQ